LPQSTTDKVEELNQQAAALKQERDKLNDEAKEWAQKRDKTHEQIRMLREEAKELKAKRDEINQKVKELKNLREQARNQQKEKRIQATRVKEKIQSFIGKKPIRGAAEIQKEIDRLDWEIQTTSMPVNEEKALVDKVRVLETQRATLKQWQDLRNTLSELQTHEKASAIQAKQHHEELTKLAEQGQEYHRQMLELVGKIAGLRPEADAAHSTFVELRQKANDVHQTLVKTLQQIDALKKERQKVEAEKLGEKQQRFKEEATLKAQEKMKRGEKLSWEEFKLLTGSEEDEEED